MFQNSNVDNKRRYKSMNNEARRLVKGLKADSREVDGGSDGKLCFTEKER